MKKVLQSEKKKSAKLIAISLLDIHLRDMKTYLPKNLYANVHMNIHKLFTMNN